jgi:hypothetical protein
MVLALVACDARSPAAPGQSTTPGATTAAPAREENGVTVSLESVTVTRREHDTLFTCEVALTNGTGGPLRVLSNFGSAFDGLVLVVTASGREIVRQAYVYHQSPFAEDRSFELAPGRDAKTLVFPVQTELPPGGAQLSVQIVGELRGTPFAGLGSNVVTTQPVASDPGATAAFPPARR